MDIESPFADVVEIIDSFSEKDERKIKFIIDKISKYGIFQLRKSKNCEHMKSCNLEEVKIKIHHGEFRIICLILQNKCWLLHAFRKKSNKIKQKDINIALNRKLQIINKLN